MCGIVGRLNFDINHGVEEASVRRMADKIIHRGPDADGYYVKKNVGLGHRRLAIIDLSPAGKNPMFDKEKTIVLVFNGEIYNFQSLRKELEKKGYVFQSNTDTEVVIYLWKEYGKNCLKYLRGMFAFALWDDSKKVLFMARDRLGKKPLKYYLGDDFIIFASELKAFIDEP
ncbi:MAG: asparagine synthetase B, partial [Candidatus Gracilibacteria bacterium]